MNATAPIDRLTSLFQRFQVRAHLLHAGPLCGINDFSSATNRGFLHVLRRGEVELTHSPRSGLPRRIVVDEPSLIFYPRPRTHHFKNAPSEGSDFVCATLEFAGGSAHPIARALPELLLLPLDKVEGIEQSLALLFDETQRVRCGSHLLADRLFEVVLIQLLRWLIDHPDATRSPPGLLHGLADPSLARALVAIHDRPEDVWTLPRMAQHAGLSRSAFAARFKAVMATTPADYLADWRVSIAQAQLRGGVPVKTIAADLGYANASALSRMFVQRVGRSPRAWLSEQAE
ncbi:AraC family transcriptional regulator [Pseudomonas sp. CGJS7]|uniref:AraC family transcriptional regulator n=1 Tax=Pseudomonas sp. CGJS7 TaxID=3109348 RepID=UPI00300A9C2F